MEKFRATVRNMTKKEYLPLWIYAAVQIAYHLMMREPEGSDALRFFSNQLDAYSLQEYLRIRYGCWTSRVLIEGVLVFVSRNIALFKVLDWAAWVFLAWAFAWLFPKEKRGTAICIIVGFLLIYPMWDLRTAGWIATGVNYTWPLAFGVFSLHGTAKALQGQKTSVFCWILYAFAALFAANMEQVSAALVAVNFCAAAYLLWNRGKARICGPVWTGLLVSAAEMLFILKCPGNAARNADEIASRMPGFVSYGLLDKIGMGFMDTMHHLVVSGNLLFLCYAGLLAAIVFAKTGDLKCRFAAVFPIVLNVGLVGFYGALKTYFPKFLKLMKKSEPIGGNNYHVAANYLPVLLYLVLIGCMLLSLVAVCESYFELFGQAILLALALATRVIMGFTPTIYVSQERTFFYLYMILGISGTFLLASHSGWLKKHERAYGALKLLGLFMAVLGIVMNLTEIGSIH